MQTMDKDTLAIPFGDLLLTHANGDNVAALEGLTLHSKLDNASEWLDWF
jgi:hypothetical protein